MLTNVHNDFHADRVELSRLERKQNDKKDRLAKWLGEEKPSERREEEKIALVSFFVCHCTRHWLNYHNGMNSTPVQCSSRFRQYFDWVSSCWIKTKESPSGLNHRGLWLVPARSRCACSMRAFSFSAWSTCPASSNLKKATSMNRNASRSLRVRYRWSGRKRVSVGGRCWRSSSSNSFNSIAKRVKP